MKIARKNMLENVMQSFFNDLYINFFFGTIKNGHIII
jgi:hypothetical protein